jgi:UDP-glucuronate decarboxylase
MLKFQINVINIDMNFIHNSLQRERDFLSEKSYVITGCGGFLGRYILTYLVTYHKELKLKKLTCVDNFRNGIPDWIRSLQEAASPEILEIRTVDVTSKDFVTFIKNQNTNYLIHAASIASPTFYREFPLETARANTEGWSNILEGTLYNKDLINMLYFSSSEIYGNPDTGNIPTKESYNGNVSCVGPRACYDESKRFGETLAWIYRSQQNLPITVVRPFNNFGPGMSLTDKRLPADLASSVIANTDIVLHSDGKPTRTFCYVADAIVGYFKALTLGINGTFNIGSDLEEMSVLELANRFAQIGRENFGYLGEVKMLASKDKDYLADNPQRRCPDLSIARTVLSYEPRIPINQGIKNYLQFCSEMVSS